MTPGELRTWREEAGLDQGGLAKRLGVWRGTVNRWEQGRQPIPRHLRVLLEHLGESVPAPVVDESRYVEVLDIETPPVLERAADGWQVRCGEQLVHFGPGAEGHARAATFLNTLSVTSG